MGKNTGTLGFKDGGIVLKDKLMDRPDLQRYVFGKGFLISDAMQINLTDYPFYGNWNVFSAGKFNIYVHDAAKAYLYTEGEKTVFLIGHAYNPYTKETDEQVIVQKIFADCKAEGHSEYIDELTGVFVIGMTNGEMLRVELDCSGMQYGCYGKIGNNIYIASHMRLIGDICGLETADYVNRLIHYRWYHYMMGNYLPGEITCFEEVKRIIPNTTLTYDGKSFLVNRFYPNRELSMCSTVAQYDDVICEAADVLKSTMELIPQKWEHPSISLTGGIDSNTTFAAANGNYEKYESFSYVSMFRESVDAEAARTISDRFGVKHNIYTVPERNEEISDFDLLKLIFIHNDGKIGTFADSDTRKKAMLLRENVCDVEVKSWVSEAIRAYAYKYFGRKKMPKSLTSRNYTSLYKIFALNRRLVRETDEYFAEYLENTDLKSHLFNYDESDFFVWEMMHGGKCGLNIGVMKLAHDITIPYNNRKLIDLLLCVPLEKRISDQHHLDLKKRMNKELWDMGIRVVNLNETERRKKLANLYFTINSLLPF